MIRRDSCSLVALVTLFAVACSSSASPSSDGNGGPGGGTGNVATADGGSSASAGIGDGTLGGSGAMSGTAGEPAAGGATAMAGTGAGGQGGASVAGASGASGASGAGASGASGATGIAGAGAGGQGGASVAGASGASGATAMAGAGAGGQGGASVAGASGASGAGGAGAIQSSGCGKMPTLENSPGTTINYNEIMSAGLNRRYILRLPDNYDPDHPYRLIIAYHWGSGTASHVFDCTTEGCVNTQSPFYGFLELAENSTIFVAPDGIDGGWANPDDRDLTFTDDMLAQIEADLCIDTTRIFANGFSYGAAMSSVVGCQRSDVFRAVALYAGGIDGISGPCPGNMPMAFYGGIGTGDDFEIGQMAAEHFAEVNGCTAQSPPEPPSGGHACISYDGCSEGYPVRFCLFDGGHTPSPRDRGQAMSWQPREAWTFFSQF